MNKKLKSALAAAFFLSLVSGAVPVSQTAKAADNERYGDNERYRDTNDVSVSTTQAAATASNTTLTPTSPVLTLQKVKLMNYYPSAENWSNMWTNWDATVINKDFGIIASLHANAVRIIVQANTF